MSQIVSEIYPEIIRFFRAYRFVDWDQTIPLTMDLINNDVAVPNWISTINHYFVDEFQDFNLAEQQLIAFLSGISDSMIVVGDDDQSIYSGRGGSPEGIRGLKDAPTSDCVSLVVCRRCSETIVERANTFQATMNAEPRPMQAYTPGGEIRCYRFGHTNSEIAFLAEFLNARIAELPENPRPQDGIVCLFPEKKVLNEYFDRLSPLVLCTRRGPSEIPSDRQWLIRVLSLISRPGQRILERLILEDFEDIKPRHKRLMVPLIAEADLSPTSAIRRLIDENGLTPNVAESCEDFIRLCNALGSRNPRAIAPLLAEKLEVAEERVLEEIENFIARLEANDEEGKSLALVCDALLPETVCAEENVHSVLFLTMHGSKGLTKKNVVLPGLEDAWLPGDIADERLPESKRLFFIALTRATDRVVITHPINRGKGDSLNFPKPGRGQPSRFVADAGMGWQYRN